LIKQFEHAIKHSCRKNLTKAGFAGVSGSFMRTGECNFQKDPYE
jgi:hypothetical protein